MRTRYYPPPPSLPGLRAIDRRMATIDQDLDRWEDVCWQVFPAPDSTIGALRLGYTEPNLVYQRWAPEPLDSRTTSSDEEPDDVDFALGIHAVQTRAQNVVAEQLQPSLATLTPVNFEYLMAIWSGEDVPAPEPCADPNETEMRAARETAIKAANVIAHIVQRLSHKMYVAIDPLNPPNAPNWRYPHLAGRRLLSIPCPYVTPEDQIVLFEHGVHTAPVEVFYANSDSKFTGRIEDLIRRLENGLRDQTARISIVPVYLAPEFRDHSDAAMSSADSDVDTAMEVDSPVDPVDQAQAARTAEWFYLHVELPRVLATSDAPELPSVHVRLPTEVPLRYLTTGPVPIRPPARITHLY